MSKIKEMRVEEIKNKRIKIIGTTGKTFAEFKLGKVRYWAGIPNSMCVVGYDWLKVDLLIAWFLPQRGNAFVGGKLGLEWEFIFEIDLYTCAVVSEEFLSKLDSWSYERSFHTERLLPEVFRYILVNLIGLEQKERNRFRFWVLNYYRYDESDGNYVFTLDRVLLTDSAGKKLKIRKPTQINPYSLVSKIYEVSVFTMPVAIAIKFASLWIDTILSLFREFNPVVSDMKTFYES